ncbi:hypothetical protein [Paenibacillus sp. FSL R10-2734]|uniref:hypothetical protein n=1 Tax=Paenibacillus sp. FSL R10-2734 TaxID=2954691 RepID=UPI0030D8A46E
MDSIYQEIKNNLKKAYGRIPVKGLPRISRLNTLTEDRRFNITDCSGNTIMVGHKLDKAENSNRELVEESTSFEKHSENISEELRFKALVLKAGIAVSMEKIDIAKEILSQVRQISLDDKSRLELTNEFKRASDIEKSLL